MIRDLFRLKVQDVATCSNPSLMACLVSLQGEVFVNPPQKKGTTTQNPCQNQHFLGHPNILRTPSEELFGSLGVYFAFPVTVPLGQKQKSSSKAIGDGQSPATNLSCEQCQQNPYIQTKQIILIRILISRLLVKTI